MSKSGSRISRRSKQFADDPDGAKEDQKV
jgi:hypothetical protein